MANRKDVFQKLHDKATKAGIERQTQRSQAWFRSAAGRMNDISPREILKNKTLQHKKNPKIGSMLFFSYKAKHRDTLPFYDKFPLIVLVGPSKDGFVGLNVHYLPPKLRADLFDALQSTTNNNRYDESTKMAPIDLGRVSKHRLYKPCVKRYLNSNVLSPFAQVPAPEWEMAVFLPTARWSGAHEKQVYRESRKQI
jgi:hypothetical protein